MGASGVAGALADPVLHPIEVIELGDVLAHRAHLGLGVRLVQLDDVIRRGSALEPHLLHDVGLQARVEQLGESEGVARRGVDGIRHGSAHGPVVRMVRVDGGPVVFGREGEDQSRLHPTDEGNDVAHEVSGRGHHAVVVAVEEHEFRNAQALARTALLVASQLAHLLM